MSMRFYETLYLLPPDLSEDDYQEIIQKFNTLIEKQKGVVIKVDVWGKKELAYRVKKFDKGYYVLLQFCGRPGITAILERDLRLDDRVMKFHTVKLADEADPEELKKQYSPPQQEVSQEQDEEPGEERAEVEDGIR